MTAPLIPRPSPPALDPRIAAGVLLGVGCTALSVAVGRSVLAGPGSPGVLGFVGLFALLGLQGWIGVRALARGPGRGSVDPPARPHRADPGARLRPHFLFNALHTVDALVREGRDAEASRALARVGGILRRCLECGVDDTVPLRDELALVDDYLSVQELRFGRRLRVHRRIDPAALDTPVPVLTVQLLLENAVRHGGLAARGEDDVFLGVETVDDRTVISVRNSIGSRNVSTTGFGVGLRAVRERLERMEALASTVSVRRRAHEFEVRIEITDRRRAPLSHRPLVEESAA